MKLKNLIPLIILAISSCNSDEKLENKITVFPFSTEIMINNELTGSLLEFIYQNPDSASQYANDICHSLKNNNDIRLEKMFTEINDTTYHFLQKISEEMPSICYSGTFYFDVDNLDTLYQYNFDLKYPVEKLKELIYEVSKDEKIPIQKLLKNSYNKEANLWTPRLFFFIQMDYENCNENSLLKTSKVIKLIENTIQKIGNNELDSNYKPAPRIIILNSRYFNSSKL